MFAIGWEMYQTRGWKSSTKNVEGARNGRAEKSLMLLVKHRWTKTVLLVYNEQTSKWQLPGKVTVYTCIRSAKNLSKSFFGTSDGFDLKLQECCLVEDVAIYSMNLILGKGGRFALPNQEFPDYAWFASSTALFYSKGGNYKLDPATKKVLEAMVA